MNISEAAAKFKMTPATIRYYERKKILIEEYQKLLEKQQLINATVARLETKLDNYDQMIQKCEQEIFSHSNDTVSAKG